MRITYRGWKINNPNRKDINIEKGMMFANTPQGMAIVPNGSQIKIKKISLLSA